jgi:hypothetical protein
MTDQQPRAHASVQRLDAGWQRSDAPPPAILRLRIRHRLPCAAWLWSGRFCSAFFAQDGQYLHLELMTELPLGGELSPKLSDQRQEPHILVARDFRCRPQ